jgi:hypothetical protein
MTAERRTALIRLLAQIDQQIISEAESLASDLLLSYDERELAETQFAIHLDAVKRIERMLESRRSFPSTSPI